MSSALAVAAVRARAFAQMHRSTASQGAMHRAQRLMSHLTAASSRPSPVRLVIIGGVAGGASTAARARRLSESAVITLLERGPDVSFANCGLPYFISGEISERSKLAVQTPESLHRLLAVDVRTHSEAVSIDRKAKMVRVKRTTDGSTYELPYDKLVMAPGASPIVPAFATAAAAASGASSRVFTLRTLDDMDRIKAQMVSDHSPIHVAVHRVLVIGAGFIGLECAESFVHLGKSVTLVEGQPHVLPQMDAEMVAAIEAELQGKGVRLVLGDMLAGITSSPSSASVTLASGLQLEADAVLLSIGVKPDAQLAAAAGLKLGVRGTIAVNEFQQTSDPDVYAVGDAVETRDSIRGTPVNIALASPASRQARTAADHIFLGPQATLPYPGSIGTAIVRVFDVAAGVTGFTEKRLRELQVPYQSTIVTAMQHASWFPGAVPVSVKLLWSPADGKLLGGQAFGCEGVDKRLDVLATALRAGLTIEGLAHLELAYAPPFGSSRDVLNIAGSSAQNIRNGLSNPVYELPTDGSAQILDVRPAAVVATAPLIPSSAQQRIINIPYDEIRQRMSELSKDKPVITFCSVGKTAYFAHRILAQHGFDSRCHVGGVHIINAGKVTTPTTPASCSAPTVGITTVAAPIVASTAASLAPMHLDACGLACPGPLMRLRDSVTLLAPGQELIVTASDAGFANDLPAFCKAKDMELVALSKSKGIITGRIKKPAAAGSCTAAVLGLSGVSPSSSASSPATRSSGATLVVFSCEMDKVLAALVIANGAAAMGGPVTMFFTFWGLNALRKEAGATEPQSTEEAAKAATASKQGVVPASASAAPSPSASESKSVMDSMFGFMMPQGLGALPLSHMNYAGAGAALLKWRMQSKQLPNLPGLLADARKSNVRMVACAMSMEAMGIKRHELIDGVEIGGVADYLGAAQQANTNLFI